MICNKCKQDLSDDLFQVFFINRKQYRRKCCTRCKIDQQNKRRQENRRWLNEIKKSFACKSCGFSDFRALVFHHVNPDEKDINLAECSSWSKKRILDEIGKCEILCANCHTILHYNNRYGITEK